MKATRFVRAIAATAVGALTIAGISAVAAPAGAATRSTVVIVESNALTSRLMMRSNIAATSTGAGSVSPAAS